MLSILFHQNHHHHHHLTIYTTPCKWGICSRKLFRKLLLGMKGDSTLHHSFFNTFHITDTVIGTTPRNTIMNKFLSHYKIVWKRGKLPWQNGNCRRMHQPWFTWLEECNVKYRWKLHSERALHGHSFPPLEAEGSTHWLHLFPGLPLFPFASYLHLCIISF